MASFYLILGLVFSLLIAIIALANNQVVTVSYIFGRAEVSLILLILGSAFAGALIMGLFSLFRAIRGALSFRHMRQQQEALQKQVKDLEEAKLFLEAELTRYKSVPADQAEAESETAEIEAEAVEQNEEKDGDASGEPL